MVKRSKKARARGRMVAKLDAECRQRVFERDGHCQRCGSTEGLQWSHVHSRRHYCLRWDEDNSKVLCIRCHAWWTYNPGLAFDWFSKRWPERWQRITRVLQANPKVRIEELYRGLNGGQSSG